MATTMPSQSGEPDLSAINAELEAWRQGDAILDPALPFITLAHAAMPLTQDSQEAAAGQESADDTVLDVVTEELGVVVLSQTCDIVRVAEQRPYVEIAPLVELTEEDYLAATKGRSLQFAAIPALAERRLVADLDRTMTIEKPLLLQIAGSARIEGCSTDPQRRKLAETLARRRSRFAFPNDFVISMKKISNYVIDKHDKNSDLGRFMRSLEDVRVECPNWGAEAPEPTLLFVFEEMATIPANAQNVSEAIASRFVPTGAFSQLRFQVVSLETMSAARHKRSDALDLDYLSTPAG